MYLAEDRILCFEIVTKKREGWTYVLIRQSWLLFLIFTFSLKYVKSAKAATDVPTSVRIASSQLRFLAYYFHHRFPSSFLSAADG